MDFRQTIGKRIKEARIEAGIPSVSDLAERSGIDRKLLYMYEYGDRLPKPTAISAIAKATGVDPGWLMGLSDKKMAVDKQYVIPSGADAIAFKQDLIATKQAVLIQMSGNTMEPTLKTGDWVLIDTQHKTLGEGLFAFKVGEETLVRRIQRTLDGAFTVIADNKEYPSQALTDKAAGKLDVVGKVILYSRKV